MTAYSKLFGNGIDSRWRGRVAPRHRGCGLPSAFCQALRAGHHATEAGEVDHASGALDSRSLSAAPLGPTGGTR